MPSVVLMPAETLRVIGAILFFGSLVGVMPPLKVRTRLPAFTTTGL